MPARGALPRRQQDSTPAAIDVDRLPRPDGAAPARAAAHGPDRRRAGAGRRLGIPVVHDLRAADVAAGGQGAPLVPVFHQALVEAASLDGPGRRAQSRRRRQRHLCRATGDDPVAFDTGPGNALIDDSMLSAPASRMDRDGAACALAGHVDEAALAALMAIPIFDQAAAEIARPQRVLARARSAALATRGRGGDARRLHGPRSRPRARCCRAEPATCGSSAAAARAIARSWRRSRERVPGRVVTADDVGWSAAMMEAQAFAYLAVRSLRGLPLSFPSTTGVPRADARRRPGAAEPGKRCA